MTDPNKNNNLPDLKIDFLGSLINESPLTSLLKVYGFNLDFITDESFQRIFNFKDVAERKNINKYIIPLSEDVKKIFLEVLDKEKTNIIYDMTHFCIEDKSELLFISYDSMEILSINVSKYPNLAKKSDEKYGELKIYKSSKMTDGGFFDDIKLPITEN
ncbi:MAG: hypothetical protein ACOZCO_06020 [Bacteroidota bacterium]